MFRVGDVPRRRWWQLRLFRRQTRVASPVVMPAWIYSRGIHNNLSQALFPHHWLQSHADSKRLDSHNPQPFKADQDPQSADRQLLERPPICQLESEGKDDRIGNSESHEIQRATQPQISSSRRRSVRTRVVKLQKD